MNTITQGIAYFLAGSFLIGTVLSKQPAVGTRQALDWLSVGVGSILVLSAFITVLSIFPLKRIGEFMKRSERYLLPILFGITLTEAVKILVDFHPITPLFIAACIFIIFVLVAIIFTSKWIFRNAVSLLDLSLTFNALAVILLLTGANVIQIVIILVFSLILLLLIVIRLDRQESGTRKNR